MKGETFLKLDKETVLSKVGEVDIIKAFWPSGYELRWNTTIKSPFRKEDHGSFIIGNKFGNITYKDMGDFKYRGDVWDFVRQIERLPDFNEVLKVIDIRMGLGIVAINKGNYQSIYRIAENGEEEIKLIPPPHFNVEYRKFNKKELDWWGKYYQGLTELKRENIYAPHKIYRNRKLLPDYDGLQFCYYYEEVDKWAVYRPHADKHATNVWERKWDKGIPITLIENFDSMKDSKLGLITKSKKDRMVISKITGIQAICSAQSEDPCCFTDQSLTTLQTNIENIVINFDNDDKGKSASKWLTDKYNFKHINVPDQYLKEGISDFADLCWHYGPQKVYEYFKSKDLTLI